MLNSYFIGKNFVVIFIFRTFVTNKTSLTKRNMALNIMSHQTNKYIEAVCNDSDVLDRMLSYLQISNITD